MGQGCQDGTARLGLFVLLGKPQLRTDLRTGLRVGASHLDDRELNRVTFSTFHGHPDIDIGEQEHLVAGTARVDLGMQRDRPADRGDDEPGPRAGLAGRREACPRLFDVELDEGVDREPP